MSEAPKILSIGTALPPHRIGQEEVKDFARGMFGDTRRDFERLLPIFDNVNVENRYFCVPLGWFEEDHTFAEKNDLYLEHALELSGKASRRALDSAGVAPSEIGAVFFVSTTGLATPSLDARLILDLGIPERHTRRETLFGHGCAAGAGGLAKAADWARSHPGKLVLLVAVELCGLTFQRGDASKANLISTSLFSDGAAAVVVGTTGDGPEIIGEDCVTWPGTEDVMGWRFTEDGFNVVLSKSVPIIVQKHFRDSLVDSCEYVGVDFEDLEHFILHPGGAKVLDAFEEVLEIEAGGLALSRGVLRDYGNMSAVTVLFILKRFLKSGEFSSGDLGVLSAMGPGFSAEHVFFRC
ncbi:MAG: 3-oxoacyl-[acyl-carrier-protein] synthase III C-terminal domain-containing protein [Rubrobacteraceae bacterium]